MTLVEALKAHVGCEHDLFVEVRSRAVRVRHAKDERTEATFYVSGDGDAARGSDAFHQVANHLIGNTRVNAGHALTKPFVITDDEYAAFLAAPAEPV